MENMEHLWKSMENMEHLWEIYRIYYRIWNMYGICVGYGKSMGYLWDICGIWVVKLNFSTRLEVQVNECN